ncbi:MAG TPA: dienelactone hydrolase family protein [Candidatus Acidoferrales bacterium]|nr:dienelactone hydrolase family protein [Candidatus Acidoferrales bacterium]
MRRSAAIFLTAVLVLLGAHATSAQEWASARLDKSPRHREWVTVKHGQRKVDTLVVYPQAKDKRPVVLVIHEIFGLTDWAQEVADEIAAQGYIAIEPDLLSGMGPHGGRTTSVTQQQAIEAVSHLDPGQITADLNAAANYGLKLPASNGRLFVAGFCWGGGQSFRYATNRRGLKAAFVFYGPPPPSETMKRITAPVYGFYGGNDERIAATVPETQTAMKTAGKTYDAVIYKGAGHGFMRSGEAPDANDANSDAREKAWVRWKVLLEEYNR